MGLASPDVFRPPDFEEARQKPVKSDPFTVCAMLDYDRIMCNPGNSVQGPYDVVAVGGTSLVLHGIKTSTFDVDFVVEEGDAMRFEMAYKRYCGNMIDVSAPGECFGTRLPADYVSRSMFIDTFGSLTLRTMSVVVITKATRLAPKDAIDISLCSTRVNVADVLNRLEDYNLDDRDTIRDAVRGALGC